MQKLSNRRGEWILERKRLIKDDGSRNVTLAVVGCTLIAAWLCVAQIIGNRIFIALCLGVFLLFTMWSCTKELSLPVLMFFLPWSTVLKLQYGSMTFFTVALILITLFLSIKKHAKFRLLYIAIALMMMITTLIAKQIDGNMFDASYIMFIFLLAFFPLVADKENRYDDFYTLSVFFALGVILAALAAKNLAGFPNISRFIEVEQYQQITRRSGFYGDPNFYSAHISCCIAAMFLLLLHEQKKLHRAIVIISIPLLLYCGFLSASKSFIVVLMITVLIWLVMFMVSKQPKGAKIALVLLTAIGVLIIFSSNSFDELFKVIGIRFSYNSSVSDLTTGRTDLWVKYIKEILADAKIFLIGKGFTNIKFSGKSTHNTIIQSVYQLGIIGTLLLIAWFITLTKSIIEKQEKEKIYFGTVLLLCVGSFTPWIALDILFFDELFLIPVFVCIGVSYFQKQNSMQTDSLNDNHLTKNKLL